MKDNIKKLNEITGYIFQDISLLQQAFTHISYQKSESNNYERLEFLGDRVLGLVISEIIFKLFPSATEGELAIRLNSLVNSSICAKISEEIGLPNMINMGIDMQCFNKRRLQGIYADVIESLIAVIYLDGGLQAVRPFIQKAWKKYFLKSDFIDKDPKTELQEWSHRKKIDKPLYQVLHRIGPDHDPIFEVSVKIPGFSQATGKGNSKQQAERAAAKKFLMDEGIWNGK